MALYFDCFLAIFPTRFYHNFRIKNLQKLAYLSIIDFAILLIFQNNFYSGRIFFLCYRANLRVVAQSGRISGLDPTSSEFEPSIIVTNGLCNSYSV